MRKRVVKIGMSWRKKPGKVREYTLSLPPSLSPSWPLVADRENAQMDQEDDSSRGPRKRPAGHSKITKKASPSKKAKRRR